MTELETEVMSLETAKLPIVHEFFKLRDVKFCYVINNSEEIKILSTREAFSLLEINDKLKIYKTLTIGEMLRELPTIHKGYSKPFLIKENKKYIADFYDEDEDELCPFALEKKIEFEYPAKALEKLFVWCLQERYLK